jgi:hypothetical protein
MISGLGSIAPTTPRPSSPPSGRGEKRVLRRVLVVPTPPPAQVYPHRGGHSQALFSIENLELLSKYGPAAWRKHAE